MQLGLRRVAAEAAESKATPLYVKIRSNAFCNWYDREDFSTFGAWKRSYTENVDIAAERALNNGKYGGPEAIFYQCDQMSGVCKKGGVIDDNKVSSDMCNVFQLRTATPTASPTSWPTATPTGYPTAAPTSAPTATPAPSPAPEPTSAPTAALSPAPHASPADAEPSGDAPSLGASSGDTILGDASTLGGKGGTLSGVSPVQEATGDPHLVNLLGQRFDLTQPGRHTLIRIPREAADSDALLLVQANATQLGSSCTDMYFQALSFTGEWVGDGFQYWAAQDDAEENRGTGWQTFGGVDLKVIWGHTSEGIHYLNLFARHLAKAGHPIGGLLGEDDHSAASARNKRCKLEIALLHRTVSISDVASTGRKSSVAEAMS